MILVYDQILDRIENSPKYSNVYAEGQCKPLIENYVDENIQSASYDVTIGKKMMIESEKVFTVNIDNKDEIDNVFVEIDMTDEYVIKPGEFIITALNERINMPDDLCAHIRPRTTFNKLGLIITSQHVNPSFNGVLKIGIKNMTAHAFRIKPKICIGQIIFEKLDQKVREDKLYRNITTSKYQGENEDFIPSKVYDEISLNAANQIYERLIKN